MCWFTSIYNTSFAVCKIADKDIKVWKIFKISPEGEICSIIYPKKWKRNVLNRAKIEVAKGPCHITIRRGLHSMKYKPYIDDYLKRDSGIMLGMWSTKYCPRFLYAYPEHKVLRCVIPKGSKYYINEHGEIVSNRLIVL